MNDLGNYSCIYIKKFMEATYTSLLNKFDS